MSKLSISAEMLSELFAGGRRQKGGAGHSANEQKGRKGRKEGLNFDPCCFYKYIP